MNKKTFLGALVLFLCVAGANGMNFPDKLAKVSTIGGIDLSKEFENYVPGSEILAALVAQTSVGREFFNKLMGITTGDGKTTDDTNPQKKQRRELTKQEIEKLEEFIGGYTKVYGADPVNELAELLVAHTGIQDSKPTHHELELCQTLAYDLGVDDPTLQVIAHEMVRQLTFESGVDRYREFEALRRLKQKKVQNLLEKLHNKPIDWKLIPPVRKRLIPVEKDAIVAISNNAQRIATVEKNNTIIIRDLSSSEQLGAIKEKDEIVDIAYSADSRKLLVITKKTERVVKKPKQEVLPQGLNNPLCLFARKVVSAISIFDANHKKIQTATFEGVITQFTWSNDGSRLALVLDHKSIVVFDLRLEKKVFSDTMSSTDDPLAFTYDDTCLVVCAPDNWRITTVVNLATRERIVLTDHENHYAKSIACSPNGKYIAIAQNNNTLELFDHVSGKLLHEIPHAGGAVVFSPDTKWLLTYTPGRGYAPARLYALPGCTLEYELSNLGDICTAKVSDDGKYVLSLSESVYGPVVGVTQLYSTTYKDWYARKLQEAYADGKNPSVTEPDGTFSLSFKRALEKKLWLINTERFKYLANKFGVRPARIILAMLFGGPKISGLA